MEYSFTEEEFEAQVLKSRGWGDPTNELFDMMEELIIEEARIIGGSGCRDKDAMVESSLADFESNGLLQSMVMNAQLGLGNTVNDFKSSICCTFNHYKRKTQE